MSSQLTRKKPLAPRPLYRRNTMAFPRELRAAIPDLHGGRVLELDSINGHASNTSLFGPLVQLKLLVKETGKLSGQFVVGMGLQVEAARQLAATLTELAEKPKSYRLWKCRMWPTQESGRTGVPLTTLRNDRRVHTRDNFTITGSTARALVSTSTRRTSATLAGPISIR